jgi:hypothetical protein
MAEEALLVARLRLVDLRLDLIGFGVGSVFSGSGFVDSSSTGLDSIETSLIARAGEASRDGGGLARSGAGLSTPSRNGRDSIDGLSRFHVAAREAERGVMDRDRVVRGVFRRLLRISSGLTAPGRRGSGGAGYAYGV